MIQGSDARSLLEVRRYLFRLVDELNMSLNSLTVENFAPDAAEQIGGKKLSEAAKKQLDQTQSELKSLIIKNANEVNAEIEEITHSLESNYVAVSDFGTFQENIKSEVSETASAIQTKIDTRSEIFGQYMSTTQGYIRQGIVGHEGMTPIIGIAIGQKITVTGEKETYKGIEYDTIDTTDNMSVWTKDKLSFYVSGSEVAYFANDALTVNKISTGSMEINSDWSIDASNGLAFKWIRGDV